MKSLIGLNAFRILVFVVSHGSGLDFNLFSSFPCACSRTRAWFHVLHVSDSVNNLMHKSRNQQLKYYHAAIQVDLHP